MAKEKPQGKVDSSFIYDDESDTAFCKCGAELEPDSVSPQHTNRMRCPNPDCLVQAVTLIRPKRNSKRPVRFRNVKTCPVIA